MSSSSARKRYFCFLSAALLLGGYSATARLMGATQAGPPAGHGDPVAPILLALVLIALGAALGGQAMSRLGQPAGSGELLIGMLVANLGYYFHEPVLTLLRESETVRRILDMALVLNVSLGRGAQLVLPAGGHADRLAQILSGESGMAAISVYAFVDLLSRIAIIVLMFLVGLETSVNEMRRVGRTALLVAALGVVAPFLLGLGAMALLQPEAPLGTRLFISGILTATSVGITARVLRDLQQTYRTEAKIILGAAAIDDVLGLLVLAVASALVATGTIGWLRVAGGVRRSAGVLFGCPSFR